MPPILNTITCGACTIDGGSVSEWIDEEQEDGTYKARKLNETETTELRKIGYKSWYDWSIKYWGTKWNAYEQIEIAPNKVQFETAWSGVTKLMVLVSKQFPDVLFTYKYADLAFKLRPNRAKYYELIDGQYKYKDGEE